MEGSRNRHSGFSIVEVLVVAVAIVIIGAVGYIAYQHTKQSATRTDAASNPNQSTQQTPAPAGPTVAYLTITEWGIKVPLSDAIKDAYYLPSVGNVDEHGNVNVMWLSVRSGTAAACDPANNNKGGYGAIGSIMRIEPGQQDGVTGELLSKEFPNGTTVGGYYYAYKSWASGNTCAPATDLQTIDTAFTSAINGQVKPSN